MAEAQAALAAVLLEQGSHAEAEDCWRAALSARESLLGVQHPLSLQTHQGALLHCTAAAEHDVWGFPGSDTMGPPWAQTVIAMLMPAAAGMLSLAWLDIKLLMQVLRRR